MRSRFSAFALGLSEYLLASWHPDTRPPTLELDDTEWRRLQIVDVSGDVVEVRASYRSAEVGGLLHERSRFAQLDGRWYYVEPVS
jgi:SEC-C motif-containing protein